MPPIDVTPLSRISVVMPIHNEATTIRRALDSVVAQSLQPLEVLVVDGGSSDSTLDILAEYNDYVRVLDNPKGIAAAGLNIGLAAASGDVIVRVDGHWWLEPDYLERVMSALQRPNAWCAGGQMVQDWLDDDPMHRAIALAASSPLGQNDTDTVHRVDTVYGAAWPRSTFRHVGGFDEELVRNQDDEHSLRIRVAGGSIWCDPRAVLHYRPRSTLRSFFDQYRQYGLWKIAVYRKHPSSMRPRHFALAAWVATLPLGIVLPWVWVPSVGLYALVIVRAAVRRDRGLAPRIAAALVARHVGFGLGMWQGLARLLVPRLRSGNHR